MELIKNNIHMNVIKKNLVTTFFVNHEGVVNEAYPEIKQIISKQERVIADNVSVRNNQVVIDGTFSYQMLYYSDGSELAYGLEGESGFQETIKVPEIEEAEATARLEVISASVQMVNPRNYIYKIQVMAYITIEQLEDLECAKAVQQDGIMVLEKTMDTLSVAADKTDTFRITEQLTVPAGKPAIDKIVWKDVRIKNMNTRVLNRQVEIQGTLSVFAIYIADVENSPEQWIETTVDFSGVVEVEEADEDQISYVDAKLHTVNLAATADENYETKTIELSALLRLNIKLYEESGITTIEDVYANDCKLVPKIEEKSYNRLLVKNQARTKNTIKIDTPQGGGNILQLCNGSAGLKIENIIVGDNSVKIMGKLNAQIIYISSDDKNPVQAKNQEVLFEHKIDAENISPQDKYYIDWRTEEVSANMVNTNQVEIKTVIAMEVLVFRTETGNFITEIEEEPLDMEEVSHIPLVRGYIVQSGDTLWQLAKKNHTTSSEIMRINELKEEHIRKGDKLLIVKSCQ